MVETSLLMPPVQLPSCPQAPRGPVPDGVLPLSHRGTSLETPSRHHSPTSQARHQHPCPSQLPETHQR